jgi:hypothetical protein
MKYRTVCNGQCMGRDWEHVFATVDTNAPVYSGDVVRIVVRDCRTGHYYGLIKLLETTRDGRWWLSCLEGVVPLCAHFVPASIEKVIEREPLPSHLCDVREAAGGDRVTIKLWDELSLDARAEWTQHGKPRGVLFPGVEAALSVGVPPTHWDTAYRLPPRYYGEPV